ncbi:MAG: arsenic resistance protein [Anaerolineaceae bacterium]|nr:arsenic resistance protein [Anaerolineaceae bacterium]
MSLLEKFQPIIILLAVFIGLALGQVNAIAAWAGRFILPFLILMLLGVFIQLPLRQVAGAFRHGRVAGLSLLINFVWNPLFAWLLGWLFLRQQPALWLGLIMLMVTPCTDWYLVFTNIARGNVALSTALLPWNLLLQLLLLPLYLLLLAGTLVPLEWQVLVESVALVLLLPLVTAVLLRRLLLRVKGRDWLEQKLLPAIQPGQILFLGLAITAMFASEGAALLESPLVFLALLPPVLLFFAINFGLVYLLARRLHIGYADYAALCCTTLARNSPIALAIALVAFPERPLVALALVIGPLIELPVLSIVSQLLLRVQRGGHLEFITVDIPDDAQ